MRRLLIAAGAAAMAASIAGCGVGTQSKAQDIDRSAVPFALLAPASTSTSTVASRTSVTVFFEGPNGLVPVERQVTGRATLSAALDKLASGPSAADSAAALQSPASTVTPLALKRVEAGVAWIWVPATFAQLGGQDQIIAAAQIVYTATAAPGITGVMLLVNGQRSDVPVADGTLKQGPLTRADYPQ